MELCRALCESRGWQVSEVITDNDISASSGAPRPGYERLLAAMRAGADVVVVYHVDRLTRRLIDLEEVIAICETSGTRLATVTGDLDLSTDTGRLLARILASVARGEVERKGRRQRDANRQRAAQGKARWVRRPFGYTKQDGRVIVVEPEAEAIRAAAEAVLKGVPLARIAREWNERGLLTTAGKAWVTTSVRRAISNPRLAGRSMYRGEDMGEGEWPPILDGDTLARLEEVLSDPRRRTAFNNTAKHLLSGIAECGRCGRQMYGTPAGTGGRRWLAYRCPDYHVTRRIDLVDEVVESVVIARLSQPDALPLLTPDVDLDGLRARAEELRDRRDALASMLAEGLLPASAVREQARRLREELTMVEAEIEVAAGQSPAVSVAGAADVTGAWRALPLASKREAIRSLMRVSVAPVGKGARFSPDQVLIEWRVL